MLANKLAGAVEPFDADIVEMHTPMHTRPCAGFGDDQERLLLQKCADRRCDSHRFIPMLQQPHAGIAQQSKTRPGYRCEDFITSEDVIARTKKRKILLDHPFEKR